MHDDTYTERCSILAKWLEIRQLIGEIQGVNKNMTTASPNYASYVNRLEDLRKSMTVMQREYPWLGRVIIELGKGITL